jgi:predicted enzyme related to lactoylglutathione lyase
MGGKVVWHDLVTKDTNRAGAFYGQLFGWEVREKEMGGATHRLIHAGEDSIGCFVAQPPDDPMPPHWVAYVHVDDLDAAVGRAKRGGGSAPVPRMAITDQDSFAILKDPLGAVIAAYENRGLSDDYPKMGPGRFCWEELLTKDPLAMVRFYGELFGWGHEPVEMPMGTYHLLKLGDQGVAGVMQMPPDVPSPPHWLSYVAVESVDKSAAKAVKLGARQYVPPTDIPNIGRFSVLADPQGAVFAIYRTAMPPK